MTSIRSFFVKFLDLPIFVSSFGSRILLRNFQASLSRDVAFSDIVLSSAQLFLNVPNSILRDLCSSLYNIWISSFLR